MCGGSRQEKWFDNGIRWKIGRSEKVRFWEDSCLEGKCLVNLFSRLHLISEQKKGSDGEYGGMG